MKLTTRINALLSIITTFLLFNYLYATVAMIWYKDLWVLNEVAIVRKGNNYGIAVTQNDSKLHFWNLRKKESHGFIETFLSK